MIATSRSDSIQDFLAFFRQMVGSPAAEQRVGASVNDIEQFVALAQFPLPTLYLGYLREFGEHDPVLQMADDGDSQVKALIEFYEEQAREAELEIPVNGVVIATQGLSGGRALFYREMPSSDMQQGREMEEPSVVVNWWGAVGDTCAQTFRNYLYSQAFVRGRFRDGVRKSVYRVHQHLLPDIREFAITAALRPYWFTDSFRGCLERDDGTVIYITQTQERTTVYVRATTEAKCDELKHALIRQFGMR